MPFPDGQYIAMEILNDLALYGRWKMWAPPLIAVRPCLARRAPRDPHEARVRLLQARHGVGVPGGGREAVHRVLPECLGPLLRRVPQQGPRAVAERYAHETSVDVKHLITFFLVIVLMERDHFCWIHDVRTTPTPRI